MRTPESRDSSETRIPSPPSSEAQQLALQRRQALDLQQRSIRNTQADQGMGRRRPPG